MNPRESIHRLAIVNRGEAAMRCVRAVKSLRAQEGSRISAVALYTGVDRDAPFVRHADLAAELPVTGSEVAAYLDHDLLIETLLRVEADGAVVRVGDVADVSLKEPDLDYGRHLNETRAVGLDVLKECPILFQRHSIELLTGQHAEAYVMRDEQVRGRRRLHTGDWKKRFSPRFGLRR